MKTEKEMANGEGRKPLRPSGRGCEIQHIDRAHVKKALGLALLPEKF